MWCLYVQVFRWIRWLTVAIDRHKVSTWPLWFFNLKKLSRRWLAWTKGGHRRVDLLHGAKRLHREDLSGSPTKASSAGRESLTLTVQQVLFHRGLIKKVNRQPGGVVTDSLNVLRDFLKLRVCGQLYSMGMPAGCKDVCRFHWVLWGNLSRCAILPHSSGRVCNISTHQSPYAIGFLGWSNGGFLWLECLKRNRQTGRTAIFSDGLYGLKPEPKKWSVTVLCLLRCQRGPAPAGLE